MKSLREKLLKRAIPQIDLPQDVAKPQILIPDSSNVLPLQDNIKSNAILPDAPTEPHKTGFAPKKAIAPDEPQPNDLTPKIAPSGLFPEEYEEIKEPVNTKVTPQEKFDNLIKQFYNTHPYSFDATLNHELEVKFGTKGIKPLLRNDYDNVIKKLKSSGFKIVGDSNGEYYLRVNCEFLDSATGRFKLSDIRAEIKGLHVIQEYCKTNDIKAVYATNPASIDLIHKKPGFIDNKRIFPVDVDDFNFRVAYQTETKTSQGLRTFMMEGWRKAKKEFRFINRVSFEHPDYPFVVDISIAKFANKGSDRHGRPNRGHVIRVYTLEESNIFNNPEIYEIEIEVNNKRVGPATAFDTPQLIAAALRKVIKFVLSGLQGTNFPISYHEQKKISTSYMKMIWEDEYDPTKYINSRNFIGPSPITLQLKNIARIDDNSNDTNIRKGFVVTDKADGDRHLLFVSNEGKIYLINSNMDIIFTGAKSSNSECFNAILDGELISHDKNGKFINLYAAFDIYYIKNKDVRAETFMMMDIEEDVYKSRYQLLKYVEYNLNPESIMKNNTSDKKTMTDLLRQYKGKGGEILSPLRFTVKEFFPNNNKQTIFEGCNTILQKERQNRFEYTTDGLIFTHAFYGVGSTEIGKAGPKTKITWEQCFKWKPPYYNTIDFLVTTVKASNGDDVVKSVFEDGTNTSNFSSNIDNYKTIELRCGFNESTDGFINPCQDVIDDKLPEFKPRFEDKGGNDYVPMRFYPTEPYDPNAGICKIMLRDDSSGGKKMFSEENEVFEDNTIVEFRYDLDKEEGWRWIPLRVRHDKTGKLRRGDKEYGNAYKVCNSNWKSIHPTGRIDVDMLSTGLNIPSMSVSEDVYYNTVAGKYKTEAMKNFHNLYVKKKLIVSASKQGDTLIDFACGKAGDLPKWINAKLSFVFGVDISSDNLENRLDGACTRFLNAKKKYKTIPYALFVNGNSAYNIKDGDAMLSDKAKQVTSAVFGRGPKDADKLGKGVTRQYGKGVDGFNVSSCQFAIHYFFQTPDTLKGFMRNLAECTKINGYFIGTCYDGKLIFKELSKVKTSDSVKIIDNGKKIWEITKEYGSDIFEDNSSSIGYEITVFQESINQQISEYLVNFDYLSRVMTAYGFELVVREEANNLGLPASTGLFSELFLQMSDEIEKNKFNSKDYANAQFMTAYEKKISFLNRYFIYKKVRTVNIETIQLELGEYQETTTSINASDTLRAQENAVKKTKKSQPKKIRKLDKKMLLVAATESVDDIQPPPLTIKQPSVKSKKIKTAKKLVFVDNSDDDEDV